jgi:8-oxo-dGTP pyrophosphatase MutT (NUDIX family)
MEQDKMNPNASDGPEYQYHNKYNKYQEHNCGNCGKKGHIYKHCRRPHMSYGLVCFYQGKIILIQRKHSFGYIEFLRGKYSLNNEDYIISLFDSMSRRERDFISKTRMFDKLREDLGMPKEKSFYKSEYDEAAAKFNLLIITGRLDQLIGKSEVMWEETEWGLPKGRRNDDETDIECAVREFSEETGIDTKYISILDNVIPLEENYIASNGINYNHIYYIAVIDENSGFNEEMMFVNPQNPEQMKEINMVKLMDYNEAISVIRPYYINKINVIKKSFQIIECIPNYFE